MQKRLIYNICHLCLLKCPTMWVKHSSSHRVKHPKETQQAPMSAKARK